VPSEAERELAHRLPAAAELPSPAKFENLLNTRAYLTNTDRDFRSDLWQTSTLVPTAESLSAILKKIQAALDPFKGGERWKMAAVYAGRNGGPHRDPWDNLVAQIEHARDEIARSQEILLRHAPALSSPNPVEEQEQTALEIHTYLRQNGTLGFVTLFTHKHWKQLVDTATVGGERPTLPEHFLAISKFCRTKSLRRELSARWDRQMSPLGAAPSKSFGEDIETSAVQYCAPIRSALLGARVPGRPSKRH
jgi:hypothetical protein